VVVGVLEEAGFVFIGLFADSFFAAIRLRSCFNLVVQRLQYGMPFGSNHTVTPQLQHALGMVGIGSSGKEPFYPLPRAKEFAYDVHPRYTDLRNRECCPQNRTVPRHGW
jgi:hypothetical protein